MFVRIFKIELEKAFKNKMFFISLAFCLLVSVLCTVYNAQVCGEEFNMYITSQSADTVSVNPNMPLFSLFNHWLCEDLTSLSASVFFIFAPVTAALPYGASLYNEMKSGYVKNMIVRTDRRYYFFGKFTAAFLSGGCTVAVPAAVNFLLSAMFIPAAAPDVFYDIGWTVRESSMFSGVFFSHPYIYVLLRCAVVFMFGGMFALTSFSLGFFIHNRFAVLLAPLLLSLAVHFGQNFIPAGLNIPELSPIYIMCANGYRIKKLWCVTAEFAAAVTASAAAAYFRGVKRDVL